MKYNKLIHLHLLSLGGRDLSHMIIGLMLTALLSVSCESYVDVELPKSQLTGEAVFGDRATVRAALNDIYAQLRDQVLLTGSTRGMGNLLGLYADEMDFYGSDGTPGTMFYQHSILATDATVGHWWEGGYNLIYAANALVEGLKESSDIQEDYRRQFIGEALLIRGYMHLLLVELFGEVPYVTTTDYLTNRSVSRLPREEVYAHIIEDLTTSSTMLTEQDESGERIYPTTSVANALLSRAYQNIGAWELAEEMANNVINSNYVQWESDLDQVFLKGSKSTLWQFKVASEGLPTLEGSNYIFVEGPPSGNALTNNLLEAFEEGDGRKSHWVGTVSSGGDSWSYVHKYKQRNNSVSSPEYSIVLRLAEQYLIRAEARVHLGNLSGAKEDLDKIRKRAGLDGYPSSSKEQLLEAIILERRLEFFTEHGMRWFDLKRTGKATEVLAPLKAGWRDTDILFPIPESELSANPNIGPQNEGY